MVPALSVRSHRDDGFPGGIARSERNGPGGSGISSALDSTGQDEFIAPAEQPVFQPAVDAAKGEKEAPEHLVFPMVADVQLRQAFLQGGDDARVAMPQVEDAPRCNGS